MMGGESVCGGRGGTKVGREISVERERERFWGSRGVGEIRGGREGMKEGEHGR